MGETLPAVIGVFECSDTAAGIGALDAALKSAPVEVVWSVTVNPGKLVWIITGDEASVPIALDAASAFCRGLGEGTMIDRLFLPAAAPDVSAAIQGEKREPAVDAAALVEMATVTAGIAVADVMAKAADVRIARIVMDDRLAGRASVRVTGRVGEVDAALAEAQAAASAAGRVIVRTVRIPRPHDDLWEHLELAYDR